jgi:hypothetical protein
MKGKPRPEKYRRKKKQLSIVLNTSGFMPGKAHERCAHLSFRLTITQDVAQPQYQFVVWTQTPMVSVVQVNALKLAAMHF